MQRYRELMTICCAAVLSLGLAACGGSGGGDDDQTMMMCPAGQIGTYPDCSPAPEPEPEPEPVAVSVPDADYLDEDNMPPAGTLTIAAGMTATSGGVTYLCAEGGDACEVTIDEDGMATATGGMVTASLTADAMMQVTEAKEMMADEEEAARLVRVKRVIGEDRAIEGVTDLARIGNTTGLDATEIRISRAEGGTARIRVSGTASGDTGVGGYVAAEDAAMANGDWVGSRLERPVAGATQQLVAYTDIEEPSRVQFYNFDGRSTTPSRYADTGTAPVDAGGDRVPYTSANNPNTALAIFGGSPITNGFTGAVLDQTQFPQRGPAESGDVRKRFPVNLNSNPGTNTTPDTVSFRGNYNGAPGTYTCLPAGAISENGACTVSVTPAGVYSSVTTGDVWTFTPELGATAFRADAEFVRFGWWMQTPRSPDGTYTFNTWFHGNNYVVAGAPVGSATYTGRAAGRYAVQELGTAGVIDGSSGEFTAAASLTATFSPTANMISGTVNGFQGNGDADMSGWEVTLNRINIGATTALASPFATTVTDPTATNFNGATATMGDQTAHGIWGGQFLGNDTTVSDPAAGGSTANNVNNAFPRAVGGSFQADNEAVSIAGAFGARR